MRWTGLVLLMLALITPAVAGEVEFSNTFAVTDRDRGELALSTRVENRSRRAEDIYVTRNGVRQKVGTLRPGAKASVTVLPIGDGVIIWNEHE